MTTQLVKTPIGVFPSHEAYKRLVAAGIQPDSDNLTSLSTQVEVYEPHPVNKGMLKFVRNKTARELWKDIESLLSFYVLDWKDRFDYIGLPALSKEDEPLPEYHYIACYVVPGSNEGHYLHADLILRDDRVHRIFLGKTFLGAGKAWEVAIAISTILEF